MTVPGCEVSGDAVKHDAGHLFACFRCITYPLHCTCVCLHRSLPRGILHNCCLLQQAITLSRDKQQLMVFCWVWCDEDNLYPHGNVHVLSSVVFFTAKSFQVASQPCVGTTACGTGLKANLCCNFVAGSVAVPFNSGRDSLSWFGFVLWTFLWLFLWLW